MKLMRRSVVILGVVVLLGGCSSSESPSVEGQQVGAPDTSTGEPSDGGDVVIGRRDFQVIYRLDAVSASSATVGLMSNRQLSFVPSVTADSAVSEGQTVGQAVIDPDVEAALEASSGASSIDKARLGQLRALEGPVVAPVGGVFGLVDTFPVVHAPGIDVVVALNPIQDLRYQSLGLTGRAVIETVVGQREVACEAVWTQQLEVARESSDGLESGASEFHCRLPRYLETAAGLRAQVVLESPRLEDVVVVPNTYVGYDETTDGYFIKVIDAGVVSTVPVVAGVTDGVVRVITSDVPLGAVLVSPEEE